MYMFLRRSLAHISYMYIFYFLMSVHLGVLPPPPPPPYQKAGYATALEYTHLAGFNHVCIYVILVTLFFVNAVI